MISFLRCWLCTKQMSFIRSIEIFDHNGTLCEARKEKDRSILFYYCFGRHNGFWQQQWDLFSLCLLFAVHCIMVNGHSMRWSNAIVIDLKSLERKRCDKIGSYSSKLYHWWDRIASNLSWVSECVNKQEPIRRNLNSICYVAIDCGT